jgi:integrase
MAVRKRGRKGHPWYRSSEDAWYIKIRGQLIRLANGKENEDEALRQWHGLMARQEVKTRQDDNEFKTIAEEYLDDVSPRLDAKTYKNKRWFLQSFFDRWPGLAIRQLTTKHVRQWQEKPTWSSLTGWTAGIQLRAVLNWAAKKKLITENPLSEMPRGKTPRRGENAIVDPADRGRLLEEAPPHIRDVLIALELTGFRPKEVFAVEAKNVDLERRLWIFTKHKTVDRTDRNKYVALSDKMLVMTKRLMAAHPVVARRLGVEHSQRYGREARRGQERDLGQESGHERPAPRPLEEPLRRCDRPGPDRFAGAEAAQVLGQVQGAGVALSR